MGSNPIWGSDFPEFPVGSIVTKYFKQEPIQRRFDFSGTPLKSNLRCIGSCNQMYVVSALA